MIQLSILRWGIILDDLGGPGGIIRVPSEQEAVRDEGRRCVKDGRRVQNPRNASCHQRLKKARKPVLSDLPEGSSPVDNLTLAQED